MTFLPVELLRIGATTFLYGLSIFGWGYLICRILKSEDSLADFIAARFVMGCFALYLAFLFLAAAGFLRPAWIGVVLAAGLVYGLFQLRPVWAKLRGGLGQIRHWPLEERRLFAVLCF